MATRSVHWHPRLRPKRLWPSGRPMNVTTADSIVMPIGTEKEIKVSDVMKYASISQPMLDAIQGGITQKAKDADADVAFARFEVGHQHADEKGGLRPVNGTLHDLSLIHI